MALKIFKPITPGQRGKVSLIRNTVKKSDEKLPKRLKGGIKNNGGRASSGRISVRHQGGGARRHYRVVDFRRNDKDGIPAKVEALQYDPNRTADLALLLYADGERRFMIAPKGISVGDQVVSGPDAPIKVGNCMPIKNIPVGTVIHCVEMKIGKGAQIARSAGASVQLAAREGDYATLRLRSGETRKISVACRAVIGEVGNSEHSLVKLGKAGAKRWRGIRPTVRGVAMNPVDHPHGGGEGKTSGGRHPVTPWGVKTKGFKTGRNRNLRKRNRMIIRRRNDKN